MKSGEAERHQRLQSCFKEYPILLILYRSKIQNELSQRTAQQLLVSWKKDDKDVQENQHLKLQTKKNNIVRTRPKEKRVANSFCL